MKTIVHIHKNGGIGTTFCGLISPEVVKVSQRNAERGTCKVCKQWCDYRAKKARKGALNALMQVKRGAR